MTMLKNVMLLASIAMISINLAVAATYTVGAPNGGWDQSTDLATWASLQTFVAGDILIFQYTPNHDVTEVSAADFASCSPNNPLVPPHTGGSTVITLSSTSTRYFICGTGGHCLGGMKLQINTFPAPSPPPATSPPPRPVILPPPPRPVILPPPPPPATVPPPPPATPRSVPPPPPAALPPSPPPATPPSVPPPPPATSPSVSSPPPKSSAVAPSPSPKHSQYWPAPKASPVSGPTLPPVAASSPIGSSLTPTPTPPPSSAVKLISVNNMGIMMTACSGLMMVIMFFGF